MAISSYVQQNTGGCMDGGKIRVLYTEYGFNSESANQEWGNYTRGDIDVEYSDAILDKLTALADLIVGMDFYEGDKYKTHSLPELISETIEQYLECSGCDCFHGIDGISNSFLYEHCEELQEFADTCFVDYVNRAFFIYGDKYRLADLLLDAFRELLRFELLEACYSQIVANRIARRINSEGYFCNVDGDIDRSGISAASAAVALKTCIGFVFEDYREATPFEIMNYADEFSGACFIECKYAAGFYY